MLQDIKKFNRKYKRCVCGQCRKIFYRQRKNVRNKIFCSRECFYKQIKKIIIKFSLSENSNKYNMERNFADKIKKAERLYTLSQEKHMKSIVMCKNFYKCGNTVERESATRIARCFSCKESEQRARAFKRKMIK